MNKTEFSAQLRKALSNMPSKDADDSVQYYEEMIDDRIESGMSEEAAVADLGTPEEAAREIMLNMPLPSLIKSKCKPQNPLKVWEIILLVLGSPIWLSIGIAVLAVIFSVYAVIWSVIAVIWALDVSLLAFALGGLFTFGYLLISSPLNALLYLGLALLAAGGTVLLFFACLKLTVLFVKISIKILRIIKALIIGKDKRNEQNS